MKIFYVIAALATLSSADICRAQTDKGGTFDFRSTQDSPAPVQPKLDAKLAKTAKLNVMQAQAIALAAYSGKVTEVELEKESGGSGLRYSFDIQRDGATQEVGVDALTGEVLENKPD